MTWLRDTLLHFRPRSWPIVLSHYAAGAALVWFNRPAGTDAHTAATLAQAIFGGLLWAVCLNGGTLAINSAFDRDTGDIGYLDNPPPVPRGLAWVAVAFMFAGLAAALVLPRPYLWAYAACLFLSLLYSVPPVRLKAVAGADLVINMVGYGGLTYLGGALATGGWQVAGERFHFPILMLAGSFCLLFGAFYPMTQIYQIPEDAARGDRNLVIRFGVRNSLVFSLVAAGGCFALQISAGLLLHMAPWGLAVLGAVGAMWIGFTAHWIARLGAYPDKAGMYRALRLWALADGAVIACFAFALAPA